MALFNIVKTIVDNQMYNCSFRNIKFVPIALMFDLQNKRV